VLALHPRAAARVARAPWRRRIQGRITITRADQSEVTAVCTAKSCSRARAIARVAHTDDVTLRKPAYQGGPQPPGDVRWRLRPCAVPAIPLRRTL
jgi:hypothetical protein